ncbi:hypothetical protein AAFF_G00213310 [Aldrovandia affinis]|uniref:Uncharacterized protein n=1 Tax=Aldrovandia affinis TaxID=143900 RepID=A0AAD7RHE6_9TELE|nr:hypothetical protein AAFF_G00213310 [Aldrovandia affinis]
MSSVSLPPLAIYCELRKTIEAKKASLKCVAAASQLAPAVRLLRRGSSRAPSRFRVQLNRKLIWPTTRRGGRRMAAAFGGVCGRMCSASLEHPLPFPQQQEKKKKRQLTFNWETSPSRVFPLSAATWSRVDGQLARSAAHPHHLPPSVHIPSGRGLKDALVADTRRPGERQGGKNGPERRGLQACYLLRSRYSEPADLIQGKCGPEQGCRMERDCTGELEVVWWSDAGKRSVHTREFGNTATWDLEMSFIRSTSLGILGSQTQRRFTDMHVLSKGTRGAVEYWTC